MNWFWYGYTEAGGHGLYGEVVAYLRRKVRDFITRQAPYDRLPERIPYVGHCSLDDGLWLVVGKPSGTGTFYGCVVDEREYGRHGFSPYKLISADPPTEPVLAVVGSPLESDELPLPVDSVDYLQFAARLFEGLEPRERQVTHHSIVSKEQSNDGAFFVFERGSGDAGLDGFSREEDEEETEERPGPMADEIRILRETVAHLAKSVELADQRLRDELARFGAEFERRIGEGITVGMRGELEGVERMLKSATDWPTRLERVEEAVRAQSDRLDAVRDAAATSPARKWRVARIAAVVVILVAVFVSLYSDIDDLKSIASEIRTEVWGPDATLTNVASDVDALKDDVAQVKQTFSDPDGKLSQVAAGVAAVKTDVGSVKETVSDTGGKLTHVVADVGAVKTDVATVKDVVSGESGTLSRVASDLDAVKTDVATVKDVVSGESGTLSRVASDLDAVKTDVATVKDVVSGEPGTLSQVASDLDAVKSDVATVKDVVSGEPGTLSQVASDLDAVKSDVATVKDVVSGEPGTLSQVASDLDAVKSDVATVKDVVSGEPGTLSQVASDLDAVKTDVATVKDVVSGEPGTLSQVASDVKAMRSDYLKMKEIVEKDRQIISREKAENEDGT